PHVSQTSNSFRTSDAETVTTSSSSGDRRFGGSTRSIGFRGITSARYRNLKKPLRTAHEWYRVPAACSRHVSRYCRQSFAVIVEASGGSTTDLPPHIGMSREL